MSKKTITKKLNNVAKIVFKEENIITRKITEEEIKLQQHHDEKMAKRFGFYSYEDLLEYLEICNSNIDWIKQYAATGFLHEKTHIQEFLDNPMDFQAKVKSFKYFGYKYFGH